MPDGILGKVGGKPGRNSEEISTEAQGLIGTDNLILKRASQHFKACLVMCLVGKKISIMCLSFHREISLFLRVPQG